MIPMGGFYSAEDADSEGIEGKFYLWKKNEIEELLGDDAPAFISAYHVMSEGNFIAQETGERTGDNILHLTAPPEQLASIAGVPEEEYILGTFTCKGTPFRQPEGPASRH